MLTSEVRNGLPVRVHRGRAVRTCNVILPLPRHIEVCRPQGNEALLAFLGKGETSFESSSMLSHLLRSREQISAQVELYRAKKGGWSFRPYRLYGIHPVDEVLLNWGKLSNIIAFRLVARFATTDLLRAAFPEKIDDLSWLLDESRTTVGRRVVKNLDLTGLDLSKMCFDGIAFKCCDFSNANCSEVDFTGARFFDCKFFGTDLRAARMLRTTFSNNCLLDRVNIIDADFSDASFLLANPQQIGEINGKGRGPFRVYTGESGWPSGFVEVCLELSEEFCKSYAKLSVDGFVVVRGWLPKIV